MEVENDPQMIYPDDEIKTLLALAERCTVGPWEAREDWYISSKDHYKGCHAEVKCSPDVPANSPEHKHNALLIAASRQALPAIAKEVLAARETIAQQDIEIKLLRAELSLRSTLEGKFDKNTVMRNTGDDLVRSLPTQEEPT